MTISTAAAPPAVEPKTPLLHIAGRIVEVQGSKPAPAAIVRAIHLDSGKVFEAHPASSTGFFEIRELPYGYYTIAVESDGVLHAGAAPINLAPGRPNLKLVLRLGPSNPETTAVSAGAVTIPGLDKPATAGLEILGGDAKRPFLSSPAGISTLVGGSLLLLLLLR